MTAGLKQASSTKLRLYKNKLEPNSTDNDVNKYKALEISTTDLNIMLCLPIIIKNAVLTKIM